MRISESSLRQSTGRGARTVALALLSAVRETRKSLDAGVPDALHDFRVALRRLRSWVRAFRGSHDDTLSGKDERRLKRIARATGACRDLEVHIAWVERARRSQKRAARHGADWLLRRLHREQRDCESELDAVIERRFDSAVHGFHAALSRSNSRAARDEPVFAATAADLVRAHLSDLASALGRVTTIGDGDKAHRARIAAKRLRYLIEPLHGTIDGVGAMVDELARMQDLLGALHDAQTFAVDIDSAIDESVDGQDPETDDPVPGLRAMARRLKREEKAAFKQVKAAWLDDGAAPLFGRVATIAEALDQVARAT